jgi:energy-coupling factor transport system permease protein
MNGFLDYVPGTSPLHRLNPLSKLVLSLVLCVCCFVSEAHLYILSIIVFNLLLAVSAGIFKRALKMLIALLKFSILLFILQVLFIRDGAVLFTLPLNIPITDKGVSFSLLFVLRLLAATMPLATMLSVMQMSELSGVLVEKLHIPYKYTFGLTTAIRFIPIFMAEASDIMMAQTARGVEFDTKNFFKKIKLLLPLCVPLLISSVKRIDRGAISAELRGFSCRKRGYSYHKYNMKWIDLMAGLLCAAAIFLAVII